MKKVAGVLLILFALFAGGCAFFLGLFLADGGMGYGEPDPSAWAITAGMAVLAGLAIWGGLRLLR